MEFKFITHYRYANGYHSERKFFTLAGALRSARMAAGEFTVIRLVDNVTMVQTKGFWW